MRRALPESDEERGYHWGMMRGIWSSAADLAVVQAQDLLGLGHGSRMNTPSTLGGNWCWRAEPGVFNTRLAKKLHSEMELYGRCRNEKQTFVLWCRLVLRAGSAA